MANQRDPDKVRVTVPMPRDMEKALKNAAHEEQTDRVDVIKRAVELWLRTHGTKRKK